MTQYAGVPVATKPGDFLLPRTKVLATTRIHVAPNRPMSPSGYCGFCTRGLSSPEIVRVALPDGCGGPERSSTDTPAASPRSAADDDCAMTSRALAISLLSLAHALVAFRKVVKVQYPRTTSSNPRMATSGVILFKNAPTNEPSNNDGLVISNKSHSMRGPWPDGCFACALCIIAVIAPPARHACESAVEACTSKRRMTINNGTNKPPPPTPTLIAKPLITAKAMPAVMSRVICSSNRALWRHLSVAKSQTKWSGHKLSRSLQYSLHSGWPFVHHILKPQRSCAWLKSKRPCFSHSLSG
mmetsp:Transcript_104290/g.301712  ORF Transcript_104290/g.301712 Transcript_104290/m.301712 type:complete len:299 (-) Transcript_104290:675-1571(-)